MPRYVLQLGPKQYISHYDTETNIATCRGYPDRDGISLVTAMVYLREFEIRSEIKVRFIHADGTIDDTREVRLDTITLTQEHSVYPNGLDADYLRGARRNV